MGDNSGWADYIKKSRICGFEAILTDNDPNANPHMVMAGAVGPIGLSVQTGGNCPTLCFVKAISNDSKIIHQIEF